MREKTKILCFVICITTLLCLSFSVYGQEKEEHTHETAIKTEKELLQMQNGGSYYLANDITTSETITVTGEIHFCLNGKILQYQNNEKNGSIFYIQKEGALNIHDCSEEMHTCAVEGNGRWILSDETEKENQENVTGGLIIGGTGTTRELKELQTSYVCGGFVYADGGTLRIYGGNIVGNTADQGGAVYLTESAKLEIYGGKFCGNVSAYRGGAVFSQSGSVLMNGGVISKNRANKNGGGIHISENSLFEIKEGILTGNSARVDGGGFENFGILEMRGGTVSGNIAGEDGGGIYNGSSFTMQGGTVRENTAKYGAGICNDSTFVLHDGKILANLAQESGGGLYNAHTFEMRGGIISGNTAKTSGGGIESDGTSVMYDGVIGGEDTTDANAAYLGGGICIYRGTFTMHGGRIEKNTGIDGGGIENEAEFIMTGGIITQNFASVHGGGISNRGMLTLKGTASIMGNGSGTYAKAEYKGGGIYWIVDEGSSVNLESAVTVINNTTNGEAANLVIGGDGELSVSELSENARIGLTLLNQNKKETAGPIFRYNENENREKMSACFSSDNALYVLKWKRNEVRLSEKNTDLAIALLLGFSVIITATAAIGFFVIRKNKRNKL